MPVLTAALSSSGVDAAGAWTWYLMHTLQVDKGGHMGYDHATMLLEVRLEIWIDQKS
jgi:hypothetical protein